MVAMDGDQGRPNRIVYSLVNSESGQPRGWGSDSLGAKVRFPNPLGPGPPPSGWVPLGLSPSPHRMRTPGPQSPPAG